MEAGQPLADALAAAAEAAAEGARSTVPMQARKGRASYLGERSIGHEDPGAASTAIARSSRWRSARAVARRGLMRAGARDGRRSA